MGTIFKSSTARRSECLISFMVVGPENLRCKIADGLHQNATERKWYVSVHQCESIADIVKAKLDICVDFIIFAFDPRALHTLTEVRANITVIDEYYITSGVTCLVNCNGISNAMGTIHKAKALCENYNIRLLSADVLNARAHMQLGNRILNITEGMLGLNNGIPIIRTQ